MGQAKSKVMPAHQKQLEEELQRWSRKKYKKRDRRVFGMLLRVVLNRYGGRRHPVLDTFETLMKRKLLTELSFIPRGSVIVYISHQWVGINHPDPRGDQFYHLVLLLERLLRGDVDRTFGITQTCSGYNHSARDVVDFVGESVDVVRR